MTSEQPTRTIVKRLKYAVFTRTRLAHLYAASDPVLTLTEAPQPITSEGTAFASSQARIDETFNDIQHTVQARGDATVERAMIRRTRLSIRFGTLNHCVMDENNTTGAACLENAVIPEGHKGPLQDRCRPDCRINSVIGPEHLPIWATERQTPHQHIIAACQSKSPAATRIRRR